MTPLRQTSRPMISRAVPLLAVPTLRCCHAWFATSNHITKYSVRSHQSMDITTAPEDDGEVRPRRRLAWDVEPFSVAESVVDRIISGRESSTGPILERLESANGEGSGDFPALFNALYGTEPAPLLPQELLLDGPPAETDRKRRYCLHVAYKGSDFCGWQRQPKNLDLPSVQQTLEEWLNELIQAARGKIDRANLSKNQQKRLERYPSYAAVRVCGRTDAGVHAVGQVCRFRTTPEMALEEADIRKHLERKSQASTSLSVVRMVLASPAFEPRFCATNRAYAYLIDQGGDESNHWFTSMSDGQLQLLDDMLLQLEGQRLEYVGLSYGKLETDSSECVLSHARARRVRMQGGGREAVCIELVGNRFLRRMVRIMVATALKLVERDQPADALLRVIQKQDRSRSSPPAPSGGLIFVSADFQKNLKKAAGARSGSQDDD